MTSNLETVSIIDSFESLIWTERYRQYGDFETVLPSDDNNLILITQIEYVLLRGSDSIMIVEDIQITSDVEDGSKLIVSGRSLESILERRIIWNQTILDGNLQEGVKKLLDENVISPIIEERKINNFIFQSSTDPKITELTISAQFTGDSLYDAIEAICSAYNLGFRIIFNSLGQLVFSLYSGTDRSYDQFLYPYVVFSPKFENLSNSRYLQSSKNLKTVTLVAGEGEGASRKTKVVENETGADVGLKRREMFTDARDISSDIGEGIMTIEQYESLLDQRGKEKLSENTTVKFFEGQAETTVMFKYGEDFFIGDIVQIANEYGLESRSRIAEIIRSQSIDGINVVPTFETI